MGRSQLISDPFCVNLILHSAVHIALLLPLTINDDEITECLIRHKLQQTISFTLFHVVEEKRWVEYMHVDGKKGDSHWIVFMVCIFGWQGLSAWGTRSLCLLLLWLCKDRKGRSLMMNFTAN